MTESSYMIAPGSTNEDLALKRKIALALMQQGSDASPIQHPTQGLARMVQAALGGYGVYRAEQDDKEETAKGNALLAKALPGAGSPPTAPQAPATPPPALPPGGKGYGDAIASIESGGKYDILGPVTKTGDRAYGKYQVMGANVPVWTKAHLGQEMSPQDFLRNPQAQDAVFNGQFNQYVSKYGPEGAAKAWFAGERGMNNPNARDQLGTTVSSYANKFTQALGGPTQQPMPQAAQQGGPNREAIIQMLGNRKTAPIAQKIIAEQLSQQFKPQSTDDIKEYEYAKRNGFQGSLGDWMGIKRGGAGEYGLQPIWGVDAEGKPAITQLGKGGKAVQSQLPPGFQISRDPIKIDAGTDWILIDPQTRQPVGRQPKNIEGKEAAEERGRATGQAQVNLPNALAQADLALKNISQIRTHPGRNAFGGVGMSGVLPGIPGTDQAGFVSLVDQLKGKTFLTAFESLRGGGAITEIEGKKAESAIARLQRTQNDRDFDAALQDLEDVIKAGMERAKQKAGGVSALAPAPAAPSPSGSGVRKYNPATGKIE